MTTPPRVRWISSAIFTLALPKDTRCKIPSTRVCASEYLISRKKPPQVLIISRSALFFYRPGWLPKAGWYLPNPGDNLASFLYLF